MREPTLMSQNRVNVAEVIVGRRLRPISEAGVASLIESVHETGVMKDAIHVRKKKDGHLHLMAGGHRLEMAKRLGWTEIEAKVWADVTDDWARLMEIDDNLAGAEMNALDTAVFLATRKAIYERLHPETKRGVAGAKGRWDATELSSVAFVTATAEKFGLSERQVRKIAAAGASLHPDQVDELRRAPRAVTLLDLQALSKAEPVQRSDAVRAFAAGEVKKLSHALKSRVETPLKDPIEDALKALRALWKRTPKVARQRFVEGNAAEFEALLNGVGGDE